MLLASAVQLTGEPSVPADRLLAARPWIVEKMLGGAGSVAAILGGARGSPPHAESRLWRAARSPSNTRSSDVAEQLGPVWFLEQLGARWYRLAAESLAAPLTATMTVVHEVARDFPSARRVLNFISDRYLYRR